MEGTNLDPYYFNPEGEAYPKALIWLEEWEHLRPTNK